MTLQLKSISGRNCRDMYVKMPHILEHTTGASEVMLYQFLNNPEFDHPFKDYTAPVPTWDELETLGGMVLEKIPKVILVGEKGKVVLNR